MEQGMAPEQAPQEGGGDASSDVVKMVSNLSKGMSILGQVVEAAGAPDSAKQKLAQAQQLFQEGVAELTGEAAPQGEAPMEPPGAKAVPMQSPEGRPVSPAGV